MKKLLIILLLFTASCKQTQFIERTQTMTDIQRDTLYINRWGNDSIVYRTVNDTVFLERYKTVINTVYKTEFKEKTDTVKIEVTKETIKKVPNQAFLYLLFPVLFLLIILVGYLLKLF